MIILDIKSIVLNLVLQQQSRCPFKLSKQLDLCVLSKTMHDTIPSYSLTLGDRRCILINNSLPVMYQNIHCAEQLGLHLLHNVDDDILLSQPPGGITQYKTDAKLFAKILLE